LKAWGYVGLVVGTVLVGAAIWRLAGASPRGIPPIDGVSARSESGPSSSATLSDNAPASKDVAERESPFVSETPEEEGALTGTVVDTDGKPVPGADVRAIRGVGQGEQDEVTLAVRLGGREVARGVSDAKGRFELRIAAGCAHDLRATAAGLAEAFLGDATSGQDVEIVMQHRSGLFGTIRREGQKSPIAGASLDLLAPDGPRIEWSGETDETGNYIAEGFAAGPLVLVVTPPEGASALAPLVLKEGERREVSVEVPAGVSVVGRVTAADGGTPIAGAEVTAESFRPRAVLTNVEGRYELPYVHSQDSRVIVSARAPGYGRFELALDPSTGSVLQADFELARGRVVKGRLVSRAGTPVPGAIVRAYGRWDREPITRSDDVSTRTGENGEFQLDGVRTDLTHLLLVRKERFATSAVATIPQGEAGDLDLGDLAIGAGAILSGTVSTPDGKPVRAIVNLKPQACQGLAQCPLECWVRSDTRGAFTFVDLGPGTLSLRADADGIPTSEERLVDLAEGDVKTGVEIHLGGGGFLEGSVVGADEHPVEGAFVFLSGPESAEARSKKDGSFRFEGLSPGTYQLSASLDDSPRAPEVIGSRTIDVRPGNRAAVLHLRAAAILRGRVVTPEGEAVVPAEVRAATKSGDWSDEAGVDANGGFSFLVPAGEAIGLRAWRRALAPDGSFVVPFRLDDPDPDPPQAYLENLHGGDAEVLLTIRR
jgi:hypothetical protein